MTNTACMPMACFGTLVPQDVSRTQERRRKLLPASMVDGVTTLSGISVSPELCMYTSVGRQHEEVKGSMHHTMASYVYVTIRGALYSPLGWAGRTHAQQADTPA